MKKKNLLLYFASGLIPLTIVLLSAWVNKYVPFGEDMLNAYDSFTQYPGMLLEYKRAILSASPFYSFHGGGGFNLFGTLTYYTMSPLNILCLFADSKNYPFFIAYMTFLRFFLLGFCSSIYFSSKTNKSIYIILFSTIYALIGFNATYYYNYIWIDCVILLPLIILAFDRLVDNKNPIPYVFLLSIAIISNFYIGYMICIFIGLYFIYSIVTKKNRLKILKRVLICSITSVLISMIVIIPSYFALKTGKATIYEYTNYKGLVPEGKYFFYYLVSGSYEKGNQAYGPAQVYCSLLVVVLTFFYFFNSKFTLIEKIATLLIIAFFMASFQIKCLNLFWQFFQRPIWWQSRFSFTFNFFLIVIAFKTLINIKHTNYHIIFRIISMIVLFGLILGSTYYYFTGRQMKIYQYFFLIFNFVVLMEFFLLIDNKKFFVFIVLLSLFDLSLNTYNSFKQNTKYKNYLDSDVVKKELPGEIEYLNNKNKYFYRMELVDDFSSNDGLYFGFNGINYFNSARNVNVVYFMKNVGLNVADNCHFKLQTFDPAVLSILNIKYLYGDMEYYKTVTKKIKENPYPLSIGYMVPSSIKDVKLKDLKKENNESIKYTKNVNKLMSGLYGKKVNLYKVVADNDLKYTFYSNYTTAEYSFIPKHDYMVFPMKNQNIEVLNNNSNLNLNSVDKHTLVLKNQKILFRYNYSNSYNERIYFILFDIDEYEKVMKEVSKNLLYGNKGKSITSVFKGKVKVKEKQTLFTTIEYEKGMKVFVDKKEYKPNILFGTFISLDLDNGEHEIEIKYIPKGFLIGLVLSITGIILAIICKRNYNKDTNYERRIGRNQQV